MPILSARGGASATAYGWSNPSSQPGLILTARTLPVTFNMNGFAKGGTSSLWFVGSSGSTSAATSSDGITWTTITASRAMYNLFAGNPGSSYASGDGNNIQYSSDGTTWTLGSTYWSGSATFMKYFANLPAYIKKYSGTAAERGTTSGSSWFNLSGTNYTSYDAASNGNVVGWPTYGASYYEYTTNGSWTSITSTSSNLGQTRNWVGTAYDSVNGRFVVYDDQDRLAYSSTGTGSWTIITRPQQSGVGYRMSNDGGGGAYVLGGYESYLYSTDSTTWVNVPVNAGAGRYVLARWDSSNNRFLIMQTGTTQYYTGVKP